MCSFEKRGNLFFLTLTGDEVDQHRLNPTLISSIQSSLSEARSRSTRGSVLITTVSPGKYFCTGFDITKSSFASPSDTVRISEFLKPLAADFLSLPMPTIAVVTGHAVGAGLGLAICHDYVFMRRGRAILCMNEIDKGIRLPDYAVELIRSKVVDPKSRRDILLCGVKLTAERAVAIGVVDMVFESQESALEGGVRMGEELAKRKWDGEVYTNIRKYLYPDLCRILGLLGPNKHVLKPRL